GQDVPLEVLSTPIATSGQTLHVVVSREISERKRAEAALRESEQMFRLLFETSSDGIMILDPATETFVDCNDAAVQMSRGGTREWMLSHPLSMLAPELQPDGRCSATLIRETIARTLDKGCQHFEWTGRAFNGEEFPMEVSLTPLR